MIHDYIYVYVRIYVYTCVCLYIYMCVYIYAHSRTHACAAIYTVCWLGNFENVLRHVSGLIMLYNLVTIDIYDFLSSGHFNTFDCP